VGEDLVVVIGGGTHPHVGAMGVTIPKVPNIPAGSFLREGHREDIVVDRVLRSFSAYVRGATVVMAGIHIDAASSGEIQRLLDHVDCLAQEIARYLIGNLRAVRAVQEQNEGRGLPTPEMAGEAFGMERELNHIGEHGRARMVDVTAKSESERVAVAVARVQMEAETLRRIQEGGVAKGDVLAVAQVAGILAAKRTWELIPMCHPLPITSVDIDFAFFLDERVLEIRAEVKTTAKTGVEMEALTAVQVSALTVYDMVKAVDRSLVLGPAYLLEKRGGKSGDYRRPDPLPH